MKLRSVTIAVTILFAAALLAPAQTVQQQCLYPTQWVYCSAAPQPQFAQAPVSSKSSGSVATLTATFGSNTRTGNTLVVVFSNGNNNNATAPITDTLALTWFKAVQVANSTAFETEIWYAPNTSSGADTITVTPGGSNASIAMTIYEVPGLVYPAAGSSPTGPQSLDQTASNTGTGATSPAVSITPIVSNEYVFVGFGLGTAAQTITVSGNAYHNDSGQQNPTTPAGLFSFVSASLYKSEMATSSPAATATSEPWAVAVASFKTISIPVQGTVQGLGAAGTPSGGLLSVQGAASMTPLEVSPTTTANATGNPFFVTGSGTAGSAATNPITVQGIASMTPVEVSPTTAANTATNPFFSEPTDGTNAMGAMANFGTSPGAVKALNVNSASFAIPTTSSTNAATVFEADALTTTSTVKSSAGNFYGYYVYNPNASVCFLEVFNTTSPTLGTTAPILSLGIPATGAANLGPQAIALGNFSTAIAVAATTASKGASTCGTGMTVNVYYQ